MRIPGRKLLGLAVLLSTAACSEPYDAPAIPPPVALTWVDIGRPIREAFGIAGPFRFYGATAPAKRVYQFSQAKAIGLSHYRHELIWSEIETAPGTFNWIDDDSVAEAASYGQSVLGILAYGNPLYNGGKEHHYPPADPNTIAGYAEAAGEHYKGTIDRWEFWNEPNGGYRFWRDKIGGDPIAFGKLADVAGRALKRGNPGARLALGGLFYHDYAVVPGAPRFLDAVLEAQPSLATSYDAVSYHPYKPYPPVDPPEMAGSWDEDQDTTVDRMRAVMDKHGLGKKEIWITENGWPISSVVSEKQQGAYLVRGALLAFAKGVVEYDWYTFFEYDSLENLIALPEAFFGLVTPGDRDKPLDFDPLGTNPPRPKIGFFALKTMLAEVGGANELADVAGADRVRGARILAVRGEKHVVAAWFTGIGGTLDVKLPRPWGLPPKSAVDMTGKAMKLPVEGSPLTLSPWPIYLHY